MSELTSAAEMLSRATALEQEARGYAAVGMHRKAGDMRDTANDLRQLAKEMSAKLARMGE